MVELRWGKEGKVKCPQRGSEDVAYLPSAKVFKCCQKHQKQELSLFSCHGRNGKKMILKR
jgi:hypothetical protein